MTLDSYRRDVADSRARTNTGEHKSPNYQPRTKTSVSFNTGHFVARGHGTRTATGALAMTNVSNILLLDEEDVLREATALLLVNRGANVTKVATIDDALTHLERRTYDVVLVDVSEKHANPAQMLERILTRALSPSRIVVCIEKPLLDVAPRGISHVLVKPYPFDDLVEAVFTPRRVLQYNARQAAGSGTRRVTTPRRTPILVKRGRA